MNGRDSATVQARTLPCVCRRSAEEQRRVSALPCPASLFLSPRPPSPPMKPAASRGGLAGSCLGRRGRKTWEGQTLLTSRSGSSQVSGPNPTFTNSQEIPEIRVTSTTAPNHREASGSKKGVTPSLLSTFVSPRPRLAPLNSALRGHQAQMGHGGVRSLLPLVRKYKAEASRCVGLGP